MAEIRKGFGPPPEVTAYFEGKTLRPAFSWLDVWAEEHAHAFTVAKATELELLATFRDSIATAVRNGQGFETWKTDVGKELARIGWAGPRMVSDPDGVDPDRMVNFASQRRLKNIFWSNVNSARAAGQWHRAQRTKRALPYLLYVRTTSSDPRQEHLGWVGVILPIDDPFWRSHFPPNGWGCKCQVRQISAREAAQLLGREPKEGGIFYRDSAPDLGPDIPFTNRRTGEVTMIPPGIDPGWQTNPGLMRAGNLADFLGDTMQRLPAPQRRAAIADVLASPGFRDAVARRGKAKVVVLVAPVTDQMRERAETTAAHVWLSADSVWHILDDHAERALKPEDFAHAIEVITRGELKPQKRAGNVLVFLGEAGGRLWRAVVKLLADEAYLTSFHPKSD